MTAPAIEIRVAVRDDVPELLRLMKGIVTYERGRDFRLEESDLVQRGFSVRPEFGAFVADAGDGRLVGMAVHYEIPFMHTLQPLLMMKWLFVDPDVRSAGIGEKLVRRMARHAKATGHDKFCWFVLKDNLQAQKFYRRMGAVPDPEWDRWAMPAQSLLLLADAPEDGDRRGR